MRKRESRARQVGARVEWVQGEGSTLVELASPVTIGIELYEWGYG